MEVNKPVRLTLTGCNYCFVLFGFNLPEERAKELCLALDSLQFVLSYFICLILSHQNWM